MITAERLRELVHYNQDTGVFTWLVGRRPRTQVGDVAGFLCSVGYSRIKIDGREYKAHRLAWLYMTGEWPKAEIDHINGDKGDNCFCNLRESDHSQNLTNTRVPSNNTSGFKGISWNGRDCKWVARIGVNGKQIHLGYFDKSHLAYVAYCLASRKHFGEFARVYEADQLLIPRKVFEARVLRNLLAAAQCQFIEVAA